MKNTTLRQLTVFETVARHLHFTRAAEALGTTQPSVSMQVKQLEDNLGVPLFEILGKRVYLTEAGEELYRYCCNISQHLTEAQTVFDRLRGGAGGRLNLVIAHTGKYFVPRLLAVFRQQYPDLSVHMEVAGRDDLLSRLADNTCDMAVMGSPPEGIDLFSQVFLEDPLVMIAPSEHALAREIAIPLARLAQEPFLMREPGSVTRNAVEDFFTQQSITITPSVVTNSNEAIKRGVLAGLGLAVVPLHSVTLEVEAGRLTVLDVADMHLQRSWCLVHRQGKRFSHVAETFKDFVLQEAQHQIQSAGTQSVSVAASQAPADKQAKRSSQRTR